MFCIGIHNAEKWSAVGYLVIAHVSHPALGLEGAIYYQLRMQATKSLRHVTVPANRLVFGKDVRKLLGVEILPLGRLGIWTQQRRCVVEMMQPADGLVTDRTISLFVPVRNNIPN